MNLKNNLWKNGLASFFSQAVRALEQLMLIPFFISSWGTLYYGEWITLSIIPNIIGFSDLGFGTATANSFVLNYASGNHQKAVNINKTGVSIITLMILVGVVMSIIVMLLLSNVGMFDKSTIDSKEAIQATSILILARLSRFYLHVFSSYYRAARKASLSINLLSINSLLNIFSGLIALLLGYKVVGFAISQLISIITFNIYYGFKGKRVLGVFDKYIGIFDKNEQKEITSKGIGFLMSPIWQSIYFQGTTFIVRIILGPESVTIYNTVRTLTRSLNQLFNMVNSTVFPELQFEIGSGHWKRAQSLFRISVYVVLISGILGVILLYFFGLSFYKIWTNNELHISNMTWNLFIAGILFNALWWNSEMVFSAVNKPEKLAIFGIISSIISVILSIFLSKYYGLNGIAVSSIIMEVLMALFILPYGCKLMGITISSLFIQGLNEFRDSFIGASRKLILKLK